MDERDQAIHMTSIRNVFAAFSAYYILGLLSLHIHGVIIGRSRIIVDNNLLQEIAIGSIILLFFVHSVTTIILYRQGKENE